MNHIASVRAALKATAPVVAIPVEGRVPVCIRARLLKKALKGVTIHSVVLLENGWLKVAGMATGGVRTSSSFAPVERRKALMEIRDWSIREREKRIRVINQGVLSAQAQRELKRKRIETEADTALKDAYKSLEAVYMQAKEYACVEPETYGDSERTRYAEYHASRHLRKRGSVIQWRIAELRKELSKITYQKGPKRGPKKTFPTRREYIPRMAVTMAQIVRLEAQFKALFPPVWVEFKYAADGGYWQSNGIPKRPKQAEYVTDTYDRAALAKQLREARADIRALTPPEEETKYMPVAA